MQHKQLTTNNGTIHYWLKRHADTSAKCIVFTHGMGADHTMYDAELEYFSKDYTVLVWDMPLHGLSIDYQVFSYQDMARVLHSMLQQEKITRVVLVGMSMGGVPSQMFISMFPDMVEGFIALDTLPLGMQYYAKSTLRMLKPITWIMKCLPEKVLKKQMAKSICYTKESYDKTLQMLEPLSKKQIMAQVCAVFKMFIIENKNITIQCPVLILLGEYDTLAGIQGICGKWADYIGCSLHKIEHAGHFSNGDNPEDVREEIERFLEI
ncbi:MAG: alpha/beta hydrolase [Lachnospiraceae bacterium]